MNAEISEAIRARLLGLNMQIPELLAQRKFVSARFHAHSNAHKPPKTETPTVSHSNAHKPPKTVALTVFIYSNAHKPPKTVAPTVLML